MKNFFRIRVLLAAAAAPLLSVSSSIVDAKDQKEGGEICALYFSQIGCSHCAVTDPWLFRKVLPQNDRFVLIEYELAFERENARMLLYMNQHFGASLYVPQILFGKEGPYVGDSAIPEKLPARLKGNPSPCPLPDGLHEARNLPFSTLPYSPKIWRKNRVMFRIAGTKGDSSMDGPLSRLLFEEDPESVLKGLPHRPIAPKPVSFSGGEIQFLKAVEVGGWILEWNP